MKKVNVYQLILLVAVMVGYSSCSKTEETPQPAADFTYVLTGETRTVVFTNTSLNSETYLWDFGDSKTSADKSPTHVYAQGGVYNVVLTAVGAVGTTTSTKTVSIDIPLPKNYINGGNFETGDAQYWTVLNQGQKDSLKVLTNVKYQFGYTAYKPTLGTGGSLYIFPTNTAASGVVNHEEGTLFVQNLGALAVGDYSFSGLIKTSGESKTDANAMKNEWVQFYLTDTIPVNGKDSYLDNAANTTIQLSGWYYGGWAWLNGAPWAYVVPATDGLMTHTYLTANKCDATGKFTITKAGTYRFVFKIGKGGGSTFGAGIAIDKLVINKL